MHEAVTGFLKELGYAVSMAPYEVIERCGSWYRADAQNRHVRVNGKTYDILPMGFAKRACADDANLCEVLEVNAGGGNDAQQKAVVKLLRENAFEVQYRRQLELCAAEGTVACYWRVDGADEYVQPDGSRVCRGGKLRLNYIEAGGFVPLTLDGDEVLEAAFAGDTLTAGELRHVLVVCTLDEDKRYRYRTVTFDKAYKVISDETVQLGDVKPFAVMRVAAVNNLREMKGFGLPKIEGVIPVLKALDHAFSVLYDDVSTAEKIVLINEVLCGFERRVQEVDGKPQVEVVPIKPNEQLKNRFVLLGEDKLPSQDSVLKEIVPEIRVEEIRGVIEVLLSMLSMLFGYGTRKYTFESGRIETAVQYIGERQDQMQELNRQRQEARRYIAEVVRAGLWFMNAFLDTAWDVDAAVEIAFDDSFITDRRSALEDVRSDVVQGIGGAYVRRLYLKQRYNLSEEEAERWAEENVATNGRQTEE